MGRSDYNKASEKQEEAISNYEAWAKKYSGEEGYRNALKTAQEGALTTAKNAAGAATTAARTQGLSKAEALAYGNQSTLGTYENQLAAQQGQAYGAQQDYLNNLNTVTDQRGRVRDSEQQELQDDRTFGLNVADKGMQLVEGAANAATSFIPIG